MSRKIDYEKLAEAIARRTPTDNEFVCAKHGRGDIRLNCFECWLYVFGVCLQVFALVLIIGVCIAFFTCLGDLEPEPRAEAKPSATRSNANLHNESAYDKCLRYRAHWHEKTARAFCQGEHLNP